jgi:nicotinamide phosphoribosyltransferase
MTQLKLNSLFLADGYKVGHYNMYQDGVEKVYSNFTPRANKFAPKGNNGRVLNFGHQYAIKFIVEHFNENFFYTEHRRIINNKFINVKEPFAIELKQKAIQPIKENFSVYLGVEYDTKHIEDLWDLGYLPLEIRSLDEGTESAIKIPVLFLYNTDDRFAWVTNYIETILSNMLWQPITTATNVLLMKRIVKDAVLKTDKDNLGIIDFMLHDFSMRGLTGLDAAIGSGMAFASVSKGSDSLPVIQASKHYYNETETPIYSVRASEHSQMTAGGVEGEFDIYKNLLTKFPDGILSLVSDSFDLWRVLIDYLLRLKDLIMSRNGKLVIRPDSGNPVDIICGTINYINHPYIKAVEIGNEGKSLTSEEKGVIELLWDVFGGTINEQGYKVLDPHIGMIYGEAINQDNIQEIFSKLEAKGFAATNCFFGQGSYSMTYVTRDTWGMALKCIAQQKDGKLIEIFKDPITDGGMKKSAKGLTVVYKDDNGEYYLKDQATVEEVLSENNQLKVRFKDGQFYNQTTLTEIRQKINNIL